MKSPAFPKFFKLSSTLAIGVAATCVMQASFAAVIPVWDPQVQAAVNGVHSAVSGVNSTLSNTVTPHIDYLNSTIKSTNAGLAELFNSAFFNTDSLFPTYADNSTVSMNPLANIQSKGDDSTQLTVNNQLKSVAYKINKSYRAFADTSKKELPLSTTSPDSKNNLLDILTVKTPSWDTLRLPPSPAEGAAFFNSPDQATMDKTLANNAKLLNFDAFLNPSPTSTADNGSDSDNNSSNNNSTGDNSTPQPSYVDYVLQTYEPLLPETGNSANSSEAASQDQTIFDKINAKLMDYKANNKDKDAYDFLNSITSNPDFQRFQLDLRSIEAKQSLLLSNFNYLKEQTTKQKGLGTAYNLEDKNGNPIKDASPYEIDQYQLNKTVYNPDWYKQMKTASPATLARQQLLLTSMLLRTQYKNEQLNERLLATETLQSSSTLTMSKQTLAMEEMKLKNALFPSAPSAQQNPKQATNYNYNNQSGQDYNKNYPKQPQTNKGK